jgi:pyrimidine-specific ribonucleoside hydrolase
VELSGRLTRGMTVCDYRHLCGPNPIYDVAREPQTGFKGAEPNAEAALELDYDRYMQLIYDTLRSYD